MAEKVISEQEYSDLKTKADKWDKLNDEVAKYYETYDDDGEEIPAEKDGDLCDIGEVCARMLGWL